MGNNGVTIFPKSYFTFSNSIFTQSAVNQLIDKYNNATIFERLSMQNDPFFKKLMEKGLIKINTIFDKWVYNGDYGLTWNGIPYIS